MAKQAKVQDRGEGGSIASYFRAIFEGNPKLLDTRSNDELLQRWLKDHPGEKEMPERIKGNLANVKSVLRKKNRKKPGKKKARGRGAVVAVLQNPALAFGTNRFEQLEEQIDDCLTTARNLDRGALHSVIGLLRKARNEVVWKLGQ